MWKGGGGEHNNNEQRHHQQHQYHQPAGLRGVHHDGDGDGNEWWWLDQLLAGHSWLMIMIHGNVGFVDGVDDGVDDDVDDDMMMMKTLLMVLMM